MRLPFELPNPKFRNNPENFHPCILNITFEQTSFSNICNSRSGSQSIFNHSLHGYTGWSVSSLSALIHFLSIWFKVSRSIHDNTNPLYTNGFFLLVWYNKLGIIHCTYLGVSGYNFQKIIVYYCLKLFFHLTNKHYAAFHLCLHCLQKYSFKGFTNTKC